MAALAVSETTLQQVGDLLRSSHLARKREADLAETTQTHAGPQFDASGMKGDFHGIGCSPKDYSKDNFCINLKLFHYTRGEGCPLSKPVVLLSTNFRKG